MEIWIHSKLWWTKKRWMVPCNLCKGTDVQMPHRTWTRTSCSNETNTSLTTCSIMDAKAVCRRPSRRLVVQKTWCRKQRTTIWNRRHDPDQQCTSLSVLRTISRVQDWTRHGWELTVHRRSHSMLKTHNIRCLFNGRYRWWSDNTHQKASPARQAWLLDNVGLPLPWTRNMDETDYIR